MNISLLISSCEPARLQAALIEDKSIINQNEGGLTPYSDATSLLKNIQSVYKEEKEKPKPSLKKIQKYEQKLPQLEAIVEIIRDATLQDAIEREDIAALNAMIKISQSIELPFQTGPMKFKLPKTYAEETGKASVVEWFNRRKASSMAFFTSYSGKMFDAREAEIAVIQSSLQDLDISHARAIADETLSSHRELAKTAQSAAEEMRLR